MGNPQTVCGIYSLQQHGGSEAPHPTWGTHMPSQFRNMYIQQSNATNTALQMHYKLHGKAPMACNNYSTYSNARQALVVSQIREHAVCDEEVVVKRGAASSPSDDRHLPGPSSVYTASPLLPLLAHAASVQHRTPCLSVASSECSCV